jgi:alginate O-acetyltransferase complex protein AlgI
MLFNSAPFLFVFLPLAWFGYVSCSRRLPAAAVPFLVLASLVFYGAWDVSAVPLLVGSFTANFFVGRWLVGRPPERRRLWLALAIAINLAVLGYYKYANFAVRILQDGFGAELSWTAVVLPLGISFFTFQQIAYLVDSSRAGAVESSFGRYALFSTFFAQHIAGPIVHHHEMMPQVGQRRASRLRDVGEGVTLLVLGLTKKLVLADRVAVASSAVFDAAATGYTPTSLDAWLAALAYTLQIYFDFSAYSDMAIGIGRMFGIDLPINFASPYKARSITEFWRRWHITLSRFLRDYLYIPLGGNRRGPWRQRFNLMLTMVLGGLWHGAEWTFLVWGTIHGLLLCLHHMWRSAGWGRVAIRMSTRPWLGQALTLTCVVLAWVPFRAANLTTCLRVWAGMFGANGLLPGDASKALSAASGPLGGSYARAFVWVVLGFIIALGVPNSYQLLARARLGLASRGYPDPVAEPFVGRNVWKPSRKFGVLMGIAFAVVLLELNNASEFIYFQF